MKRCSFLKGTVGVIAGVTSGVKVVTAADPCPPDISGASNTPQCGVTSSTSLSEAAASIGPGQSIQFVKNTLQAPEDIQWQVQTIWYDSVRGELQYMGKPASSQSLNYSHYVFKESTNAWSTSGQSLFPGTGHVWDVTFDPVNGDYWFRRYNDNVLRWFDRSDGANGTWKQTVSQSSPALNSGN